MQEVTMIKVRQIKIDVKKYSYDKLYNKVLKILGVKSSDVISFKINKRSIDARDKSMIWLNILMMFYGMIILLILFLI